MVTALAAAGWMCAWAQDPAVATRHLYPGIPIGSPDVEGRAGAPGLPIDEVLGRTPTRLIPQGFPVRGELLAEPGPTGPRWGAFPVTLAGKPDRAGRMTWVSGDLRVPVEVLGVLRGDEVVPDWTAGDAVALLAVPASAVLPIATAERGRLEKPKKRDVFPEGVQPPGAKEPEPWREPFARSEEPTLAAVALPSGSRIGPQVAPTLPEDDPRIGSWTRVPLLPGDPLNPSVLRTDAGRTPGRATQSLVTRDIAWRGGPPPELGSLVDVVWQGDGAACVMGPYPVVGWTGADGAPVWEVPGVGLEVVAPESESDWLLWATWTGATQALVRAPGDAASWRGASCKELPAFPAVVTARPETARVVTTAPGHSLEFPDGLAHSTFGGRFHAFGSEHEGTWRVLERDPAGAVVRTVVVRYDAKASAFDRTWQMPERVLSVPSGWPTVFELDRPATSVLNPFPGSLHVELLGPTRVFVGGTVPSRFPALLGLEYADGSAGWFTAQVTDRVWDAGIVLALGEERRFPAQALDLLISTDPVVLAVSIDDQTGEVVAQGAGDGMAVVWTVPEGTTQVYRTYFTVATPTE